MERFTPLHTSILSSKENLYFGIACSIELWMHLGSWESNKESGLLLHFYRLLKSGKKQINQTKWIHFLRESIFHVTRTCRTLSACRLLTDAKLVSIFVLYIQQAALFSHFTLMKGFSSKRQCHSFYHYHSLRNKIGRNTHLCFV